MRAEIQRCRAALRVQTIMTLPSPLPASDSRRREMGNTSDIYRYLRPIPLRAAFESANEEIAPATGDRP
ncbi:unnamed protein product, partial [Iphiclides podalirius]